MMNNLQKFVPGQIVGGKYKIIATIGHGGMGTVYKVLQVFLNKELALKVLDSKKVSDEVQMRRFQIEAKAANSLNHPSLVKVHDFGLLENDEPYLVMDLVDGVTLADFVKQQGPLSATEAAKTFAQVCRGLDYAHQQSIIHRDIKPSNIMLVNNVEPGSPGSVKIVDFGIAKIASDEKGEIQALTRTGEIFGSPLYMSPEQCSGDPIDKRTDIYSVGCTIFEALTGTPPFVGANPLRTMMLHQTGEAPRLKEASMGRTFPAELEHTVERMLCKSPHERYQSLEEVAQELDKLFTPSAAPRTKKKLEKKKAKAPVAISLSISKLAILLLSTAVLTSLGTYGLLKRFYVNPAISSPAEVPVEPGPAIKGLRLDTDNTVKAGMSGTEEKYRQQEERRNAAFARAQPIQSLIIGEGENARRQIIFPEVSIGKVFVVRKGNGGTIYSDETQAVGKQYFPVGAELDLCLGGTNADAFTNPKVLELIGPDEFSSLNINPPAERVAVDTVEDHAARETKNLAAILSIAVKWHKLTDIRIFSIAFDPQCIQELKKIRKLEDLYVCNIQKSEKVLADPILMRRMKRLSLIGCDLPEILHSVAGSKILRALVKEGREEPASALQNLVQCPNLTYLQLKPGQVTDEMVQVLLQLKELRVLYIKDSFISSAQIRDLLRNSKLSRLILSGKKGNFFRNSGVEIKDQRLILQRNP